MLDRHREDADKTRRRVSNPLARFAPERPDLWLSIRSDGDDGPVSLAPTEAFVREHEAPVRDEIEVRLRKVIQEGCGVWSLSNNGHTPTPPANLENPPPSWSTADLARAVGRDPKDWTARQAVERLAKLGVIHRNGDGPWQPSRTLFDPAAE